MTTAPRIAFDQGRIARTSDVTDLVALLFPGNRNQQHCAARILLALRGQHEPMPSLQFLMSELHVSRRTLERTRAKLSRLGLIQYVTWMNRRYGGRSGWVLSTRFGSSLRRLAAFTDTWIREVDAERVRKDLQLVELLQPQNRC